MSDEYKKKIGVPESHTLNIVSSQWSQRKGQDTDTYECEELNEQGEVIARYTIKDSTSFSLHLGGRLPGLNQPYSILNLLTYS